MIKFKTNEPYLITSKTNFVSKRRKLNIKSLITVLVCICFLGLIYGQATNKKQLKTIKAKDSISKNKVRALPVEKNKIITDTINVNIKENTSIDSLLIGKGKFLIFKKGAHASYYADKFHHRKTASGKIYNKNKLTAAHKKLPFGTIIKVTNEDNGKSVFVEVIDRGPFVRSRELDLSRRAFTQIAGSKSSGFAIVTMEILQK